MSDEGAPSPARLPTACPAGPEGVICAEEIRARRLVICDEAGRERIVAGLSSGVAEVRVTLDAGDNRSPAVLLTAGGDPDLGSTVGLSLFAGGDAVASLRATEGVGGVWRTEVWSAGLPVADEHPTTDTKAPPLDTNTPRRRRSPAGEPAYPSTSIPSSSSPGVMPRALARRSTTTNPASWSPRSSEPMFLSVDPMLGSTHQPYAYANGDPLNESDPLGLKGWYCVNNYKGHPGDTSHYFQGTNYGPPNGKCGTFLSWLSYQTQTTINYYEFIASLGVQAQGTPLTPLAPIAPPFSSPSPPPSPGLFDSIGHAVSSAADAVGNAVVSAADTVGRVAACVGNQLNPLPGHPGQPSLSFDAGGSAGAVGGAAYFYGSRADVGDVFAAPAEATGWGLLLVAAGALSYGVYGIAKAC